MKKFALILIAFFMIFSSTSAGAQDTLDKTYQQNTASYTNYKDCIRLYKLSYSKLYFLSLSSINFNKYETKEMQSRNGYIIFEAEGREFLLSVFKKDKNFTFLKLTPCDNNYYFNPMIVRKIFNYIDLHFNDDVKELKM